MPSKYLILLLTSSTLAFSVFPAWGESNTTSEITFTCEDNQGIPVTVAKNSEGKTQPIFHWKPGALTTAFTTKIKTPQELCSSVSAKLDDYVTQDYDLSSFRLAPKTQAGLPIICAALEYGGCDLVLFILASSDDPVDTANTTLKVILNREILEYNKFLGRGYSSISYQVDLFELLQNEE